MKINEKIKTASQSRDYLIQELKKQLVGPGMADHEEYSKDDFDQKYEFLNKSPRTIYSAGILFPQGDTNSSNNESDESQIA